MSKSSKLKWNYEPQASCKFWTFDVISMVDNFTDHEKLSIVFFNNTDVHFWQCFLGNYIYLFVFIYFLTKRYIDGGRHLKSNVHDGGRKYHQYACFAVYNWRQNCCDIVLKWDNFREQNNPHPSPIPSIQSWGISCFQQVARTAAQPCMEGVGEGKIYFSPFKLARRQRRPLGQNVSTYFVADCRKIARERKRKNIYNAITSFSSLIEHSSKPISV